MPILCHAASPWGGVVLAGGDGIALVKCSHAILDCLMVCWLARCRTLMALTAPSATMSCTWPPWKAGWTLRRTGGGLPSGARAASSRPGRGRGSCREAGWMNKQSRRHRPGVACSQPLRTAFAHASAHACACAGLTPSGPQNANGNGSTILGLKAVLRAG